MADGVTISSEDAGVLAQVVAARVAEAVAVERARCAAELVRLRAALAADVDRVRDALREAVGEFVDDHDGDVPVLFDPAPDAGHPFAVKANKYTFDALAEYLAAALTEETEADG